ncbi:MAG: hypothetical protein QXW80_06855 [Candidatus Micrarchaeia archaeon]|uniref:hypothetical protein n=1 Tax=Saccharolobus sp. TaxID=2100761 RepID=UPI00316F81D8
MSRKLKLYERVEPPQIVRPKKVMEYEELIKAIEGEPKGWYKVTIPNRKPSTIFVALAKKLKGREDLKLHFINKTVYIEKVE